MKFILGRGFGGLLQRTSHDDGERSLDEQLENSFPASDPPSFSPKATRYPGPHALKSIWNRPGRER